MSDTKLNLGLARDWEIVTNSISGIDIPMRNDQVFGCESIELWKSIEGYPFAKVYFSDKSENSYFFVKYDQKRGILQLKDGTLYMAKI